jgi:hypothetical protein
VAVTAEHELEAAGIARCRADYANGLIDQDELERRLGILIGLEGEWARAAAFHGGELVEVQTFGQAEPFYIVGRFEWPAELAGEILTHP